MVGSEQTILWLLVASVLFVGAAIVLTYRPKPFAPIAALAALAAAKYGHVATISGGELLFWLCATALVLNIVVLLPKEVRDSNRGLPYLATGAIAGMAIGMIVQTLAAVILCTAGGILLAAIAIGRLRVGRELGYPKRQFFNYLLAKGMPLLVAYSMLGIVLSNLLK